VADELMEPHRFAGMAGIAWVFITAIGIGLFAAAGPPPPFAEASSYANFTTASAKFFLLDAFTTGVSAALLLAFFAGLGAVFRQLDAEHLLLNTLIRGYGAASAIMLAMVGVFETVTVYVSETSAYSALTAPLWMLTQTAITFLYFFGVGATAALAAAIFNTNALPRWAGRLCMFAAVLLALGSLFTLGGTGQMGPLGLTMVLVGFLPAAITLLVLSVLLLRSSGYQNP
jgi:hypothetical protein